MSKIVADVWTKRNPEQKKKRTNKQTNKQTNKKVNKQTNKRTKRNLEHKNKRTKIETKNLNLFSILFASFNYCLLNVSQRSIEGEGMLQLMANEEMTQNVCLGYYHVLFDVWCFILLPWFLGLHSSQYTGRGFDSKLWVLCLKY